MKLKIGLLLDDYLVQAWAWEMLNQIIQDAHGDIILCVLNNNPKPSGKKSPFLYRVYRAVDRRIFLQEPDAFSKKDIRTLTGWHAKELKVYPLQSTFSDKLREEDIQTIKSYQLDILIRLGFRILKGDILASAKYGVWSYHHGDNLVNRGGPPCFWEVILGIETSGSVLQILTEDLDDGKVIYRSWSSTDPLSVERNAQKVFWKSAYFIPRLVRLLALNGEGFLQKRQVALKPEIPSKPQFYKPPQNMVMLQQLVKLWGLNLWRKLRSRIKKPHWDVYWKNNADFIQPTKSLKLINNPKNSYLADPFIVEDKGNTVMFVEFFNKQSQKGNIACAEFQKGSWSDFKKVIEENWHLSYPFIWEEKEQFWMLPESGAADRIYRYLCKEFPFAWERKDVFFEGEAYDPTLVFYKDKYWLFVNQKTHPRASPFDELFLYFSNEIENPKWHAHPMNPIVSDVRCSRPAGKIFEKNGIWYRPAQDSGKHYGHQIKIQRIKLWTEKEYEEETDQIISPGWAEGIIGTHTLNFTDNFLTVDAYSKK
jgi:hypothetical protein